MRRVTGATMSKQLARMLKRFEEQHAAWAERVARGEIGPYGAYDQWATAVDIVTYLARRPGLLPAARSSRERGTR